MSQYSCCHTWCLSFLTWSLSSDVVLSSCRFNSAFSSSNLCSAFWWSPCEPIVLKTYLSFPNAQYCNLIFFESSNSESYLCSLNDYTRMPNLKSTKHQRLVYPMNMKCTVRVQWIWLWSSVKVRDQVCVTEKWIKFVSWKNGSNLYNGNRDQVYHLKRTTFMSSSW